MSGMSWHCKHYPQMYNPLMYHIHQKILLSGFISEQVLQGAKGCIAPYFQFSVTLI